MFWNHTTFKSQTSVSLPVWKVVSIQSYRCVGTVAIPKSFHKLRYFFKVNINLQSCGTFLSCEIKYLIYSKNTFNNYFLTWISAQVKEMGGFVFRNCEIHFSRVFWVWNKWKMFDFRAVARKSHFSRVSNPKYKGKMNFTVETN